MTTTESTTGDVGSGEASGFVCEHSANESNGDTSNKRADVIKQVIGKRNVILIIVSQVLCEGNGLHQTEFTYQMHY